MQIRRPIQKYVPSLRECFLPRPGYIYSSEDFNSGESFTHAQSCIWLLGYSDLAMALLNDVDPHGAIAATTLGVSYEEYVRRKKEPLFKSTRQGAKPITFGAPTGMGVVKIVQSSRAQGSDTPAPRGPSWIDDPDRPGRKIRGYKGTRFCILTYGVERCGEHADGTPNMASTWGKRQEPIAPTCRLCLEAANQLKQAWLKQWRENEPYYELADLIKNGGMTVTGEMLDRWPWLKEVFHEGYQTEPSQVIAHWSGALRQITDLGAFSTICNTFFQRLLADVTKLAHRLVVRECMDTSVKVPSMLFHNSNVSKYAGARSPLQGSRVLAPFHDELFCEHPISESHDAASRVSEAMRDTFAYICPDVADKVGASPTLIERWFKGADPTFRTEDGEFVKADHVGARLVAWRPKIGPLTYA